MIPIILEACDWENHQLSEFQALPDKGRPLNEWKPKSKGWKSVADGVRRTIEEMQTQVKELSRTTEEVMRAKSAFQNGNVLMMIGLLDGAIEAYYMRLNCIQIMLLPITIAGLHLSEKAS